MKIYLLLLLLIITVPVFAQSYPEMITVEGGDFKMGDKQGIGKSNEQPVHRVTLNSFSIAKTETTVEQWKTYCEATGRKMPEEYPFFGWIDDQPIGNISWDDAVAYCTWLSAKTGSLYRLPTEAEWEYAARGGKLTKGYKYYSGGEDLDMIGWYDNYSHDIRYTNSVAKKRANELGLFDMSGNVWEWCNDWHGDYSTSAQTNPTGPASGTGRVLRGGSWHNYESDCRLARRIFTVPEDLNYDYGFRVVLSQ